MPSIVFCVLADQCKSWSRGVTASRALLLLDESNSGAGVSSAVVGLLPFSVAVPLLDTGAPNSYT